MIKDWEKFGKDIWDKAINAHKVGAARVEVPVVSDDGGIFTVIVTPPMYNDRKVVITDDGPITKWRHGFKNSNGDIEWGKWDE